MTEAGQKFLQSPHTVMITEDRIFSGDSDDDDDDDFAANAAALRGGGGDTVLLRMLKDLRKSMAGKLHLQPWVIFGDASLDDMSILYPITIEELKGCQGVGEGKARKFGKEFVELIHKYVDENEISRPDDFVMKSIATKSTNKIYIIQSIDRKMDLEDIASAKDLEMDELMSEIEDIVKFGTKINLDYYINANIDEDVIEEIYNYFKEEAESDSIEDAIKELGPDYEEMEIRLVRLKFLCEVAN